MNKHGNECECASKRANRAQKGLPKEKAMAEKKGNKITYIYEELKRFHNLQTVCIVESIFSSHIWMRAHNC